MLNIDLNDVSEMEFFWKLALLRILKYFAVANNAFESSKIVELIHNNVLELMSLMMNNLTISKLGRMGKLKVRNLTRNTKA